MSMTKKKRRRGLGVGQSKVENEEEKAGRPCSNSERTQEKRTTLVDTGHRSRPDLSQHLPAPAFSPFDACLFRQFAEPVAGLRVVLCLPPYSSLQSPPWSARPRAGAGEKNMAASGIHSSKQSGTRDVSTASKKARC